MYLFLLLIVLVIGIAATIIPVGKTYGMEEGLGSELWLKVAERLERLKAAPEAKPATVAAVGTAKFGKPVLVAPRLGHGSFRVLVTDAYSRRCAMTQEKILPVLEAAHIHPYSRGGAHELSNGLCLRSDLHRPFDKGYVTVDPDEKRIVVSGRLKEEFDNGKEYEVMQGRRILLPRDCRAMPLREHLLFHAENVFR